MKTLVIPDIHLKHERAQRIIDFELPDEVVFLGDFFDHKGLPENTPQNAEATAHWIVNLIDHRTDIKFKFIEGNHDAHYRRSSYFVSCSGFNAFCAGVIRQVMTERHWSHFKRYHWCGEYLLSHAGVSHQHLPNKMQHPTREQFTEWLESEVAVSDKMLEADEGHWVYCVGTCRGGFSHTGGMNWCDFDKEFQPIQGIRQIVGHSVGQEVRFTDNGDYCLDTRLTNYATITDGKLSIQKYADT